MKTLIWIAFAIYVILARKVFKRARADDSPYLSRGERVLSALVYSAFWGLLVGLPGYLLYKYVIPGFPVLE